MSRREWVAVAALTGLALALRAVYASQSLLGDELFTYDIVTRSSLGDMLVGVRETESTPPLYYLLAWLAAKLGNPDLTVRLPSIAAGTATVPLLFALTRRAGGTAAGLIAAGALALSPFALYYGSEARAYALAAFFVVAAAVLLPAALERDSRGWWVALGACVAGAVMSHYTAAFAVGWVGVWALLFRRDHARQVLVTYAGAAAVCAVWLPFAREGAAPLVIELFAPLTFNNVTDAISHSLIGLMPPVPLRAVPGNGPAYALAAVAVAAIAGVLSRWLRNGITGERDQEALLAGMALATPLGLLAYSLVSSDLFIARNLFASVPAVFACLALGVAALPAVPRVAAVAAGAVALGFGAAAGDGDEGRRPEYKEIASYVESHAGPADPLIEVEVFPAGPVRDALEVAVGDDRPVLETDADAGRIRTELASAERFVLVRVERILGGDAPRLPFGTGGWQQADERTFHGSADLGVVVYERAE